MDPPTGAPSATEADTAGVYDIGGVRWRKNSPGFQVALAQAYADHLRPRCLCRPDAHELEMYVARRWGGFHLKRMPHTGGLHAPTCGSYEPATEGAGPAALLGSAIVENPLTGQTRLALGFALSRRPVHPVQQTETHASDRNCTKRPQLSLQALLHYLWDEAELSRWQPGFAGRRSWATVRRHLLLAADNKCAGYAALSDRLYIPEMFAVARRDTLQRRRLDQWAPLLDDPVPGQRLMLLMAEVKDVLPTRDDCQVRFKHLPDVMFSVAPPVFDRLVAKHEHALALWRGDASLHLLMMSTFGLYDLGQPRIEELTLMLTTEQWLPVEHADERRLVASLVQHKRRFIKALGYGKPAGDRTSVCATLLDCGPEPVALSIDRTQHMSTPATLGIRTAGLPSPAWLWRPAQGAMPPLPSLRF